VRLTGDAGGGGRSPGELAARAGPCLRAELDLPPGYTLGVGGDIEQQRENRRQLVRVVAVAVLLVSAVLALRYEGLLNPLVILLTVPPALAGVVLALELSGAPGWSSSTSTSWRTPGASASRRGSAAGASPGPTPRMLSSQQRPDARVLRAIILALFLAAVALGWAMRSGRQRNAQAPTPAQPGAPGPAGAPGTAPPLPAPR
jgi:hypothetical protein